MYSNSYDNFDTIEQNVINGKIYAALDQLNERVENFNLPQHISEKIQTLRDSYNFIIQYFKKNVPDPNRHKIVLDLKRNILSTLDQTERIIQSRFDPFIIYSNPLQTPKLPLNPADTQDYEQFFVDLWLYPELSDEDYNALYQFFKSDASDIIKALAISAIFLSLTTFFDEKRILLLIRLTIDQQKNLWERALVSLILILYLYDQRLDLYPAILEGLKSLKKIKSFDQKLHAAVLQIIRNAKETELLDKQLQEEILPNIDKLKPTIDNLEKKIDLNKLMTDDFDEENPDWDKLAQELNISDENLLKKMGEFSMLQMEGADVMHSAFAFTKFSPFFSKISNWFIPFYPENQYVKDLLIQEADFSEKEASKLLYSLDKNPFICDSDKYSLITQIPFFPKVQRVTITKLLNLESSSLEDVYKTDKLSDPLGESRFKIIQYVQDLYRFFKLFSGLGVIPDLFDKPLDLYNKKFFSILANDDILKLIGNFFIARKIYDQAIELYSSLAKRLNEAQIYEKLGFAYQKLKDYQNALKFYKKAELFGLSPWLTKKLAFTYMKTENYKQAIFYYKKVLEQDPDNTKILINIGNCYLKLNDLENAKKIFLQIEFTSPDNIKALRALAHIHFLNKDLDKTIEYYSKISKKKPKQSDLITLAHAFFIKNDFKHALKTYKQAKDMAPDDFENQFFADSQTLFDLYNINPIDLALMYDSID